MKSILLCFCATSLFSIGQIFSIEDNFEGNGTIFNWFGDDCDYLVDKINPYNSGINTSATVFEYNDIGGQYANVRFTLSENLDLSQNHTFSLKIYIPSSGITGTQNNQISLKLQDASLGQPWTTQTEIIKNVSLDQWQEVTFDFLNDAYLNFDPGSPAPVSRNDLNRVLIQINGENNNDLVKAYIDDFNYDGWIGSCSPYNSLVWSDEFDADGPIDDTKWFHQTQLPNGNSWYNGELQHYTDRIENSYVQNGHLYLVAKNETFTDQGVTKNYTSARLNSKFAFTYGRIEVRASLPIGEGTWPAIWMLGKNISEPGAYWETQGFGTTSWPACGEIDIMEHWGSDQDYVQSALHTPSSSGNTVNKGGETGNDVSNNFHVYAAEWTPTEIRFYYDNYNVYTYAPNPQDMNTWPFIEDQYLLLNTAIINTIQPSFTESPMIVDYVRIYQNGNVIDTQTACQEFTWIDGNTYSQSTNNPTYSAVDEFGCQNTYQLDLTIENIDANITLVDSVNLNAEPSNVSYQWLDCSNGYQSIPNANSQTFTGSPGGTYAVVSFDNNCADTSDCVTLQPTLGIYDSDKQFKIYPNPSRDRINVEGSFGGSSYCIFDYAGRKIKQGIISNEELTISVESLDSGTFVLQIGNHHFPVLIID